MADDADLRRRAARGQRAKQILDDELVREAFESIERSLYKTWATTGHDEHEMRQHCYWQHQNLQDFKSYFEKALRDGNDAGKELIRRAKANQSRED